MPSLNAMDRVRPALRGFEPYDPAFSKCDINLSANENTYPLPEGYARALCEAMTQTPLNRYPDPLANELRDAIAQWHGVSRTSVMVGNGGDELLFNLLFAFGGPGRSLVVCPPCFEEYKNFAKMCETDVVEVWRRKDDYSIDEEALVLAAQSAQMVMITSPNNPTGNLVEARLVQRLLNETDAIVLLDEAYVDFAAQGASMIGEVSSQPRLVVLRTFSKAFALAGVRCGYIVAHPELVDVLAAIRQIYSEDVLAQSVAKAAVDNRDLLKPVMQNIVEQRERLRSELESIPGVYVWPSAANFLLVRVPEAGKVRARLRDEHSVLVRDFSYSPGLEDCLRITVGTPEENCKLLLALHALLD